MIKTKSLIPHLLLSLIALNGCANTSKIGVPDSYNGKLAKLVLEKNLPAHMVPTEVLEVDGIKTDNLDTVELMAGSHVFKTRCTDLKGIFPHSSTYDLEAGKQYRIRSIENNEGACFPMLLHF